MDKRSLAEGALEWIQGFTYERDLLGTDFVDMVSRDYGHAMGLVDLEGTGARFLLGGKRWLVAETTAPVSLGLIGSATADPAKWLGILLE